MPATASPRERLLAAADELFYAEGVHTVGIDRIIDRAGVAKASLYKAFGSKEELVYAYLTDRHHHLMARHRAHVAKHTDPRDRILAVFDSQAERLSDPDFRGCAFAAACAEAPRGGLIEQASTAYRQAFRALLTELAADYGAADPAATAAQLHIIYDGVGQSANLDADPGAAGSGRALAEALLS
jgi:AcrR family transcriptional regulator